MKKKQFKLGMFILIALAGCFLALSAVLVASAGVSEGSGSNDSAGGTSHARGTEPQSQTANLQSQGQSPDHKTGLGAAKPGRSEVDPCLSSATACSDGLDQDGPAAGHWQNAGSRDATGNSPPVDHDNPYLFSPGPNFFGASGAASGQFAGTGENGDTSQDGGTAGTFGTPPGPADPETTSPTDPNTTPSQLSLFFPTGSPGSEDPAGQPDNDPPPSGVTATIPEPSTFWLLIASLTILALAHRCVACSQPASRIRLHSIATKRCPSSPAANPPR